MAANFGAGDGGALGPRPLGALGRYQLLQLIGVGATAEVYRATALSDDGTAYALVVKRVLAQHAADPHFRQLFVDEARVIATLAHPNIVKLLDFGELQGSLFLALELVDGSNLEALLHAADRRQRRLPPPLAAHVIQQVARALACAHSKQIVHRDVTPRNILVSHAGEVKLADFGIARSTLRREQTALGALKGTVPYMSPEQATPGVPIDHRSDLFSLGVVFYELLFGCSPFAGEGGEPAMLRRVREASWRLPAEAHEPSLSVYVPLLERALARDAEQRWPSADALLDALAAVGEEPPSDPASWLGQWSALARRGVDAETRASPSSTDSAAVPLLLLPPVRNTAVAAASAPLQTAALAAPPALVTTAVSDEQPTRVVRAPRRQRRLPLLPTLALCAGLGAAAVLVAMLAAGTAPHAPEADASRPSPPSALSAQSQALAEPPAADAGTSGERVVLRVTPLKRAPAKLRQRATPAAPLGYLTVSSIPRARVYVDGRLIGTTPLRAHAVASGQRQVVLRDTAGRVMQRFVAQVRSGRATVHSFDNQVR